MKDIDKSALYQYQLPAGGHWSLRVQKGLALKLTDVTGLANLGMLFYNPSDLTERYNAPDTLKCQHTFKLTKGHCLYSDMGRIFCSIVEDDCGWHETVSGNSTANIITAQFGARHYQSQRNEWHQNGYDSFLVELAKYGLGAPDMAANVNWFSRVQVNDKGNMQLVAENAPGASVTLRFEMDTLVVMHACPHPLSRAKQYPQAPIDVTLFKADAVQEDDFCKNLCAENQRGFENNRLYHLGVSA